MNSISFSVFLIQFMTILKTAMWPDLGKTVDCFHHFALPWILLHIILFIYCLFPFADILLRIEWIRKYFLCCNLHKEIVENWYDFFLTCLVEYTSEIIWAWYFLFRKVINYWFNFFNEVLFRVSISSVSFDKLFLLRN